jgi:hypothetical protein
MVNNDIWIGGRQAGIRMPKVLLVEVAGSSIDSHSTLSNDKNLLSKKRMAS